MRPSGNTRQSSELMRGSASIRYGRGVSLPSERSISALKSRVAGRTLNPLACNTQTINGSGYENIVYWYKKIGKVYLEPGLNIYEDPDPQASPIGFYPLPALSLGTCGFVFGGAAPLTFTGPSTNAAGQIVVGTACQ